MWQGNPLRVISGTCRRPFTSVCACYHLWYVLKPRQTFFMVKNIYIYIYIYIYICLCVYMVFTNKRFLSSLNRIWTHNHWISLRRSSEPSGDEFKPHAEATFYSNSNFISFFSVDISFQLFSLPVTTFALKWFIIWYSTLSVLVCGFQPSKIVLINSSFSCIENVSPVNDFRICT